MTQHHAGRRRRPFTHNAERRMPSPAGARAGGIRVPACRQTSSLRWAVCSIALDRVRALISGRSLPPRQPIQRRQQRPRPVPRSATGGMRQPFSLDKRSAVGTRDSQYNGYAHSFAGMSVQFILFLGIDLGVAPAAGPATWALEAAARGATVACRAGGEPACQRHGDRLRADAHAIFAAAIVIFGVRIRGSVAGFAL